MVDDSQGIKADLDAQLAKRDAGTGVFLSHNLYDQFVDAGLIKTKNGQAYYGTHPVYINKETDAYEFKLP